MFAQLILLAISSVYCHPLRFVSQEAAEAYYKAQHENKNIGRPSTTNVNPKNPPFKGPPLQ
jgi:hypothetical protein